MTQPARLALLAATLAILAAGPPPRDPEADADVALLEKVGITPSAPGLLAHLRGRTLTPAVRDSITRDIRNLGSEDFAEREKATAALLKVGVAALAQLQEAAGSSDLEVRLRARRCLKRLEEARSLGATHAALRHLARLRPHGAAPAVLAFLPDAEEDEVEAAFTALARLTVPEGKPDPSAIEALTSREKRCRAAAAGALAALPEYRPRVRALLTDREPLVRLSAARGLALAGERGAVRPLLDLIAELPLTEANKLQDLLLLLAGDSPPVLSYGQAVPERKKDRDAWVAWWAKNEAKADLRRLSGGGEIGATLLLTFGTTKGAHASEQNLAGRTLWKIEGLNGAVDGQVLPGNRVLIAELWGAKVTERTFDGKVVWEYSIGAAGAASGPICCQRLHNGNTFIATMYTVVEVDRNGKDVFRREGVSVREAWKWPDGRIALVTVAGEYQLLDPAGKMVKSFGTGVSVGDSLAGIHFLPHGGLLVARGNDVVELNAEGKEVWKATADQPYCLTRLNNGNTLVACRIKKEVVELDRGGRVVRRFATEGTPWRARRR